MGNLSQAVFIYLFAATACALSWSGKALSIEFVFVLGLKQSQALLKAKPLALGEWNDLAIGFKV